MALDRSSELCLNSLIKRYLLKTGQLHKLVSSEVHVCISPRFHFTQLSAVRSALADQICHFVGSKTSISEFSHIIKMNALVCMG